MYSPWHVLYIMHSKSRWRHMVKKSGGYVLLLVVAQEIRHNPKIWLSQWVHEFFTEIAILAGNRKATVCATTNPKAAPQIRYIPENKLCFTTVEDKARWTHQKLNAITEEGAISYGDMKRYISRWRKAITVFNIWRTGYRIVNSDY
jgi:hypothetical protein